MDWRWVHPMNKFLARIIVATGLLLSSHMLAACERQDVSEAERLGRDFKVNVEKIKDRSKEVVIDN
jgi:hypothetical protein